MGENQEKIPGIKDEIEAAKKKSSRTRKKVLLIVAVLVIAAGAFSAYYFTQPGAKLPVSNPSSQGQDKDGAQKNQTDNNGGAQTPDGTDTQQAPDTPQNTDAQQETAPDSGTAEQAPDASELERLIDDFNSLPEGDEKEEVRQRLQEILEYAQGQYDAQQGANTPEAPADAPAQDTGGAQ